MILSSASSASRQPTTCSSATVATEPPFAPASAPASARTVLVVDDDSAMRNLAALLIESLDCQTITAKNGLEALKIIEVHPEVDLVLLDVLMPVMNGGEALRAIRATRPALPVVMISGFDMATISEKLAGATPDGFLQKPFTLQKFSEAIATTRT